MVLLVRLAEVRSKAVGQEETTTELKPVVAIAAAVHMGTDMLPIVDVRKIDAGIEGLVDEAEAEADNIEIEVEIVAGVGIEVEGALVVEVVRDRPGQESAAAVKGMARVSVV